MSENQLRAFCVRERLANLIPRTTNLSRTSASAYTRSRANLLRIRQKTDKICENLVRRKALASVSASANGMLADMRLRTYDSFPSGSELHDKYKRWFKRSSFALPKNYFSRLFWNIILSVKNIERKIFKTSFRAKKVTLTFVARRPLPLKTFVSFRKCFFFEKLVY